MRGKPKINQAVVLKHTVDPLVMHIEDISPEGDKCTCVWQDRIGAPYKSEFNTDILESYKAGQGGSTGDGKLYLVKRQENA